MVLKETSNLHLGCIFFVHFKKNIEELSERKFNDLSKSDFMLKIFGKQEELKYSKLVDCKTCEELDEKSSALKPKRNKHEESL